MDHGFIPFKRVNTSPKLDFLAKYSRFLIFLLYPKFFLLQFQNSIEVFSFPIHNDTIARIMFFPLSLNPSINGVNIG